MQQVSESLGRLLAEIHDEAAREEFPLDTEVYEKAGADPLIPILFAGSLESKLCFFARDLGRDEVQARQPLYGAAGRLVRAGVHLAMSGKKAENEEQLQKVLGKVMLTNTVPYKPPGNKAYLQKVKKRFRPFIEKLFLEHWSGSRIITLGTEALRWFSPYDKQVAVFLRDPERFRSSLEITLKTEQLSRKVTLAPLPHPSPLNQKYYSLFPEMLQARLKEFFFD